MRLALFAALILATLAGPLPYASVTSRAAAAAIDAAGYTAFDVGFADGGDLVDDALGQRLDGMAAYLPGKSPFIRVDLNWWYVQPCQGCALRWDRLDPVVNGAAARGMRVLMVLDYAPPWANGGHADDKWFPTPGADADWSALVSATARRYLDQVQAYEVWNEPNNLQFGGYEGDARARYWQLARLAYGQVHAACPGCVVLAGGSGGGNPAGTDNDSAAWLRWAYDNGYGSDFDAVAHHPYPAWNSGFGPDRPECTYPWWNLFGPPDESPACGELARVHAVMVAYGDNTRRIWGTEWGYPTAGATGLPLETIRDYMAQGVVMWRRLAYTGPLFLYSYRDGCTDAGNPECHFGVVDRDFTPKGILFTDLAAALGDSWRPSLSSGQELRRWASLLSPDGRFQLWLQEDGNLVLYRRSGGVLWASNTTGATRLVNQADGNLVLYRADGSVAWSTGTFGNGPSTLWMQDDGNLVLYRNGDAKPTWASNTVQPPG